jgi:hypothetical protein
MSMCHSGTLAMFSKFCLNTQNSTNMKVVHNCKGHISSSGWHLKFEGKIAQKLKSTVLATLHQGWDFLQIGIWFSPSIEIKLSSVRAYFVEYWSNYRSLIHRFWSLCLKNFVLDIQKCALGFESRPSGQSARTRAGASYRVATWRLSVRAPHHLLDVRAPNADAIIGTPHPELLGNMFPLEPALPAGPPTAPRPLHVVP